MTNYIRARNIKNNKEAYLFRYGNSIYGISVDFSKDTKRLTATEKRKIRDFLGIDENIQKINNIHDWEYNGDLGELYDICDAIFISEAEDGDDFVLNSNQKIQMITPIEKLKKDKYFTEERLEEVSDLVENTEKVIDNLNEVKNMIEKIKGVFVKYLNKLSEAVNNYNYRETDKNIKIIKKLFDLTDDGDVAKIIEIGDKLIEENDDINEEELKKELGI